MRVDREKFRTESALILLLAGLALLCAATQAAAAKADRPLAEILAGIDRYYAGLSSLSAAFDQLVEVPVLEKHESYKGRFYFRKPDLVRLEYSDPRGQLMVADGRWYWIFQPQEDISQAMRAPMDRMDGSVPRYVLGGDLEARFVVGLVGLEERGGVRCYVLDLVPRTESPYYRNLRAWIDSGSFATRAVRYEDESGNFKTFDLHDLRENTPIEDSKFVFVPPAGTQVLDMQ